MPISYPSTYTIINNITTSAGGGDGNATSLVGVPIVTGTLAYGDKLLYINNPTPRWQNYPDTKGYFLPILATPTNASGTSQQELTRFNFGELPPATKTIKLSYSIENNHTGSFAISSSVDSIVAQIQVSGTAAASYAEFEAALSSSQPYYLVASSSNAASNLKLYNCFLQFEF